MKHRAWALGLMILLGAGSALAGPKNEADVLFEEGKKLYDAGKLDAAAEKLAASNRADPSVGALGLLAACEEKRGRLATAYKDFAETARMAAANKDNREKYVNDRAEALKPRVPRLVIRVDPAIESPRVTRGGELVPPDQFGTELMVDPGEIEIVGTGAGKGEFRQKVSLSASSRVEGFVRLPVVGDVPPPPPFPRPGPIEHPTMRAISYVAGGIGLVGIGVGTGFGIQAISKKNTSNGPPASGGCVIGMIACDA